MVDAQTAPDGTFVLDLNWVGDAFSRRSQREAVFALIGAIAEAATYVRERRVAPDLVQQTGEFEVVTGQLPGEGPFQTHGHTLRLHISR